MKVLFKWSNMFFFIGLVLLLALLFNTQQQPPLTGQEIDNYIKKIEHLTQLPGGRHDLKALRAFLEDDNGEPFYTVNLYKFYQQAHYLDGRENPGTGREAYDRFSKVMVKLLAQQFSHPIFGSDWMADNSNNWQRLVIVRYRSRRDIAEIFASDEFAQASSHKWASIEKNERLLVQGLHLPEFKWLLVALLILLFVTFFAFSRRRRVLLADDK